MKNLLYLTLFLFTLAACKKEETPQPNQTPIDNRPPCEKNNTGTFTLFSGKDDPYSVYMDGTYKGTISAYGILRIENVSVDCYYFEIIQNSGYVFYPTKIKPTICAKKCTEVQYSF